MKTSDGETISSEYQVLCETCESAVVNYVNSLVKKVQKKGPKSKAKEEEEEEGAEAPTSTDDDDVLVSTPTEV
jgi:NACalpha-BTF3-like transcription factor